MYVHFILYFILSRNPIPKNFSLSLTFALLYLCYLARIKKVTDALHGLLFEIKFNITNREVPCMYKTVEWN